MRTITIHASGRFDRAVKHLAADLVEFERRKASIVTLTEQGDMTWRRRAALRYPQWAWFHADERGADDCAVLWDSRVWTLDGYARAVPITSVVWQRVAKYGGNLTPPTHATVVPLRSRTGGVRVVVIAVHFPTRSTALRRKAWASCVWGLRKLIRQIRRADPKAQIILNADFNADWDRPHERELMEKAAVRLNLTPAYSVAEPNRGTRGAHAIDGTWTDAGVHAVRVMDGTPASDHRPVRTVLNVTRQRHADA